MKHPFRKQIKFLVFHPIQFAFHMHRHQCHPSDGYMAQEAESGCLPKRLPVT